MIKTMTTKEFIKSLLVGVIFAVAVYLFMMFLMDLIEEESSSDEILEPKFKFTLS